MTTTLCSAAVWYDDALYVTECIHGRVIVLFCPFTSVMVPRRLALFSDSTRQHSALRVSHSYSLVRRKLNHQHTAKIGHGEHFNDWRS